MPMQHGVVRSLSSAVVCGSLLVIAAAMTGCAAKSPGERLLNTSYDRGTVGYDRTVFTTLLEHHGKIRRTVREVDGGIEATTESDDPAVAELLANHVLAMKRRMETDDRIRQWDPLYVAVFDHAESITLDVEPLPTGVRVRETSKDSAVAALIRSHATVVSGFVARGFEESRKAHEAPAALANDASRRGH